MSVGRTLQPNTGLAWRNQVPLTSVADSKVDILHHAASLSWYQLDVFDLPPSRSSPEFSNLRRHHELKSPEVPLREAHRSHGQVPEVRLVHVLVNAYAIVVKYK